MTLQKSLRRPAGAILTFGGVAKPQQVPPGCYVIGGGVGCDVVVPGCPADVAATLIIRDDGAALVSALAEGVVVDGVALPVGKEARLVPGGALGIGAEPAVILRPRAGLGAAIETVATRALPAGRGRLIELTTHGAGAFPDKSTAEVAGGTLRWLPAVALVASGLVLMSGAPDLLSGPVSGAGAQAQVGAGDVTALRLRIADADLDDRLTASSRGNAVAVSGRLDPEAFARWKDVRTGVGALGPKVLDEVTGVQAPAETLVAAVSLAPLPLVVGTDGRAYEPGATLPQGWSVVSITGDATVLEKDGERRVVRY